MIGKVINTRTTCVLILVSCSLPYRVLIGLEEENRDDPDAVDHDKSEGSLVLQIKETSCNLSGGNISQRKILTPP